MKKGTIEIIVGLFMLVGFAAFGYLALQLGEVRWLTGGNTYLLKAEFDNVSGIKKGASVQVAGVVVGSVEAIELGPENFAVLIMRLQNQVKVPVDSIASVKSQGIIGDKYIQISLGGDEELFNEGDMVTETESAIDIESLISKFAFGSAK
ncbi:outer membrane lipid asymmetry maintenance protein MlaD [Desulfopila aestuarii]|uniref:Phospholipid/cholesterol/gamma-HCH transport system substrate-binding protein n=1 Tax=Desulfopila aestuarii DSM 18488 TaxID=1121416 RepID=A0A1M7YEG3_9BACT|nr:outer membrane lipid asymmetry maintenance protein MlaD [Desulfopila aestuarii]SHO51034.1 phospholipid/cholesterol/gamma-HCH transport system substrate-binding protein [Desulfopila aestuarii DSM 18488]